MKSSSKMQYHVFYVEGCSPKIKSFKTLAASQRFVTKFMNANPYRFNEDNWIDYIYYGKRVL